jgi:hypothetical protein
LNKNPPPWTNTHTNVVKTIKLKVKHLSCLPLPDPSAFKIVETDVSDIGCGGILKIVQTSYTGKKNFLTACLNPFEI